MNEEAVVERARQAGIAVDWIDAADQPRRVPVRSLPRILDALDLHADAQPTLITGTVDRQLEIPDLGHDRSAMLELEDGTRQSLRLRGRQSLPPLPMGYHRLCHGDQEIALAVAPRRCLTVDDIAPGQKLWGLAAQVYSLRREADRGIGDTTSVSRLAGVLAREGADAVALSPLHSLFPADLTRYSPYSPSSRLFLNPLLIDPATVLGSDRVTSTTAGPDASACGLIDWPSAARRKYTMFRRLFDAFAIDDLARDSPLARDFRKFVAHGGQSLDDHARLEAEQGGWAAPVLYYAFLQWLAFGALSAAQASAKSAGMRIGLITDVAVGLDRAGTEVRSRPRDFLSGLSIGAPPDMFNAEGQDWGLTTFSPQGLKARGFEAFISMIRAAMRCAGGVRIDHALGLRRLWVLPEHASPTEGAYIAYPFDDLLRLLALESHRNQAIVIGEDLGTVPEGFRDRLHAAGIAGMDVLWFQRKQDRFLSPDQWRDDAVAMTTTHDLPTVAGWWKGSDLDTRRALGKTTDEEIAGRPRQRAALWQAFVEAGTSTEPAPKPDEADRAVDAALDFVAHAPGPLALVPLEDISASIEQPNLPGTTGEHPNWRRRFACPAEEMVQERHARRRLALLNRRKA